MSSFRKRVVLASACAAALMATAAAEERHPAGYFGYGAAPSAAQIAGWAIAARPDGQGLPPGRGNVDRGADVYVQQCAACHGTFGEGEARYPKLTGGSLKGDRPEPTVGTYWPYATTLFDYINRAMPFPAPHTLSADDVYAITAYVLNVNNIVDNNFVADRDSLAKVKMPNRDAFIWQDPRPDTNAKACMTSCVDAKTVKIEFDRGGEGPHPAHDRSARRDEAKIGARRCPCEQRSWCRHSRSRRSSRWRARQRRRRRANCSPSTAPRATA